MYAMTRRLLPAACVSSFGFLAMIFWYHVSAPKARLRLNATPIAYLDSSPTDVQRKATDHLIWEEVKKGEVLFARDTIRASGQAGARIRMEESGSMIELEPDSVIVLEQNQGKISLNLINGGLFVKNEGGQNAKAHGSLEIKVGGTKLAAGGKGLEMNIHRDQSGQASIAVAKGKVTAVAAGKSITLAQGKAGSIDAKGLETDKLMQAFQPAANAVIDIGRGDTPVAFRWTPIAADLAVFLELGESPGQLQRLGAAASGASGVTYALVPRGEHYWRLAAVTKGESTVVKTSVAYKMTAIAIQAPDLAAPADNAAMEMKEASLTQKLAWSASSGFESYEIKVGKSADFHDASTIKASGEDDQVQTTLNTTGTYYWKVIGVAKAEHRRIESATRSFTLAHAEVKPPPAALKAPLPTAPMESAHFSAAEAQTGITLRWQAVPDATSYSIKMTSLEAEGPALPDATSAHAEYQAHPSDLGRYRWSVQANIGVNKTPWSTARTLQVLPSKIAVREDASNADDKAKPSFKIAWSRGGAGVVKWRVGYSTDSNLESAKWQVFTSTTAELSPPGYGDYYVKVEGQDASGKVLAESGPRHIKADPPAKLLPPEVIQATRGPRLMADANGDLTIRWKPVEHATGYVVLVRDSSGATVFQTKTPETHVELQHLMPGKLTLLMGSINAKAEVGVVKPVKSVEVPAVSAVKPPAAINEIHIK